MFIANMLIQIFIINLSRVTSARAQLQCRRTVTTTLRQQPQQQQQQWKRGQAIATKTEQQQLSLEKSIKFPNSSNWRQISALISILAAAVCIIELYANLYRVTLTWTNVWAIGFLSTIPFCDVSNERAGAGVTGVPDALRCRNRWDALTTDDALKTYSRIYFYCTLSILLLCLLLSIAGTTKAVEIVSFALLLGISWFISYWKICIPTRTLNATA